MIQFSNIFSTPELITLGSIIQVGNATYQDLINSDTQIFDHRYIKNINSRMQTKLIHMQCEIESHDLNFPFKFTERSLPFKQIIPELRTNNVILNIARSSSPEKLPYASKYKVKLSNNNDIFERQIVMFPQQDTLYKEEPFYGILVFGTPEDPFSVVQFPSPGYNGIIEIIPIPQISLIPLQEDTKTFERKKAVLKKEFSTLKSEEKPS